MKVTKLDDGLAVGIPADVAQALGLKEGDSVTFQMLDDGRTASLRKRSREEIVEMIKSMARPLPPDWKFSRDEANER